MTFPLSYDQLVLHCELPRIEARALLAAVTGHRREWLVGHGANQAPEEVVAAFEHLCAQRLAGKPLAYLLGWREFYGRRFHVDETVLIPRHDTELLIDQTLSRLSAATRILELGTGSGCIAVTLACERPDVVVVATDGSRAALDIARRNAKNHQVEQRVSFRASRGDDDWWSPAAEGETFGIIVSNPPYVAAQDTHLIEGDLRFEPRIALTDSSQDGLASIMRIVDGAVTRLTAQGWLLLEHGYDQGLAVRRIMTHAGLLEVETIQDLAERDRVTVGRLADAQPSG